MKKVIISFLVVCSANLAAQNVGINSTGAAPNASAMLDIVSTSSGLLVPRMTSAQKTAIATPATGLLVYQTDAGTQGIGFYFYNGAAWVPFSTNNGGWGLLGNAGTVGGTNFIGTTDAQTFSIRTSNVVRSTLSATGTWIHTGGSTSVDANEMDAPASMGNAVGAIWATNNSPAAAGTSYGETAVNYSILGAIAGTKNYSFGIYGSSNSTGLRVGGILGQNLLATTWGSLGYKSSGATEYGLYYTSTGTGAGFMRNSNVQTGIGSGGYGGVLGSWTRGEIMGTMAAGELFASYNIGNEYTSGFQADIITLNDKRVAVYPVTSPDIKVYNDGIAQLKNGKTRVEFETSFSEIIGANKPIVTITPMGECKGIFISNVTNTGFDVTELNRGMSNIEFSYIVIGKRIDANNKPQLPEAISKINFDANMKTVMFDENNTEQSASPIWWDGSKLRFDSAPEKSKKKGKK